MHLFSKHLSKFLVVILFLVSQTSFAVWQWANPIPQGNTLWKVTWSDALSLYVAVGDLGTIISSSDGTVWKRRESGTANFLVGVTWSNNQFVVVGDEGIVLTSPNGINWTKQISSTNSLLESVTWSGTQFVAVGDQGTIITSPDGLTWTTQSSFINNHLYDVAWMGNGFIAVGADGSILTSSDGINWNIQNSNTVTHILGIFWLNNNYIATGSNGLLLTSPDAVTWTPRASNVNHNLYSSSFDGTTYIVVGGAGTVLTSTDSITWTEVNTGQFNTLFCSIRINGQFLLVGENGSIYTSTTPSQWMNHIGGITNDLFDGIRTSMGYISVGTAGSILTSQDGITWNVQTSNTSKDLFAIANLNQTLATVGSYGTVLTSTDTNDWTEQSSGTNNNLLSIAASQSNFIAVGVDGTILSSPDGFSWTPELSGTSEHLYTVAWSGDKFLAAGANGILLTSTNGSGWTVVPTNTTETINNLIVINQHYLAVGNYGLILTSDNGTNWNSQYSGTSENLYDAIEYGGTIYLAGGNGLFLSASASALDTWTVSSTIASSNLYGIIRMEGTFVLLGANGTILYDNLNTAPNVNAGPDQSVEEQVQISFVGTATDKEGTITNIQWLQTSGQTVVLNNPNSLTPGFTAPTLINQEILKFHLTVTDNEGASSSDDVNITVNPVNLNPTVNAGIDQSVNEQTLVTIIGTASDSDGTIASVLWSQVSGSLVQLNNVSSLTTSFITPALVNTESFEFRLTVIDNEGTIASDTIEITVNPVNVAPNVNAGIDQIVNEQSLVTLSGSASDTDGSIAVYAWSQINGSDIVINNASSALANFTSPVLTETQVLTFRLRVTDNEGAMQSDDILVTVNPINSDPIVNAGENQTVNEQTSVTLNGTASDIDGTIVTYSWTQVNGTAVILNNGATTSADFIAPTLIASETLIFRFQATDNEGSSQYDEVQITVTPVNNLPIVNTGNKIIVNEREQVSIQAFGNDLDGSITQIQWTVIDGPSISLANTNQFNTSFVAPEVLLTTNITLRLSITDNEGGVTTDDLIITVNPVNDPPNAMFDTYSTDEDVLVTLQILANDFDKDGDTIAISNVDSLSEHGGLLTKNQSNEIVYTPAKNFNGNDSFSYTIQDGNGEIDSAIVTIEVKAVNDKPTLIRGGLNGMIMSIGSTFIWTFNVEDVDSGDTHFYSVSDTSLGDAQFDGSTLTVTGQVTGSDFITVNVTDQSNSVDSIVLPITVTSPQNDTNSDGLPDDQALSLGLDPSAPDGDSDHDGIADSVEIGDPNNPTDSDLDGLIDAIESLNTSNDNTQAEFIVSAGIAKLLGLEKLSNVKISIDTDATSLLFNINKKSGLPIFSAHDMSVLDQDYNYPFGILDFVVESGTGNAIVTIHFPAEFIIPENSIIRKLDKNGVWRTFTSAEIDHQVRTITLNLKDNDDFDLDSSNGRIHDPIGLAVPATKIIFEEKTISHKTGLLGCSITTISDNSFDPTFLMLLLVSFVHLVRNNRKSARQSRN